MIQTATVPGPTGVLVDHNGNVLISVTAAQEVGVGGVLS